MGRAPYRGPYAALPRKATRADKADSADSGCCASTKYRQVEERSEVVFPHLLNLYRLCSNADRCRFSHLHYLLPAAMSSLQGTSLRTSSSLLPSYAAATRQSNPPSYAQHVDSLSPPERAFIADQITLLSNNNIRHPNVKASVRNAGSNNADIARVQGLVDDAESRHRQAPNAQRNPRANGFWRIFFTVVVLFALIPVFTVLAAVPHSFPYSHKCPGKRQARVKGTAVYFGTALGWLLVWSLLRGWKHKGRNRAKGAGAVFSIILTVFTWVGFCVVMALIWVKKVCL